MTDLFHLVQDAGVVGAGGAGFPTHVKYGPAAEVLMPGVAGNKPAGLFLVNGAECEPLLKTDQYIMSHFADKLCSAALAVKEHLHAERAIFVLKEHYHEQIEALKKAAGKGGIEFSLLDSVYPAGDEQVLLYEAAGLTVPPGGIPIAVGAVVSNAGTLLGVADALEGKPVTHKYLTVAGCVAKPMVLRVPIGISFEECISLAGGVSGAAGGLGIFVIAGGPIMGRPAAAEQIKSEVVTKTTSGILVLPEDHYLQRRGRISVEHMKNRARSVCIQCSTCSDMCPRRLLGSPLRPHLVMRALAASADMEELLKSEAGRNAMFCCECGICEIYACPMELQPCRINIMIKQEMRRLGIKPTPQAGDAPSPDRPCRRIPSRRMASRAGVLEYYDQKAEEFLDVPVCARVSIPLRMHAGAAALPCVEAGQRVEAGQLIAEIPPDSLGARVHASIGGVVKSIGDGRIVIEKEIT